MRITTRGQMAVSAMTDLAVHQRLRPVALSAISARLGISLSYLEQLFSALRRAGLVDSTRGPGGGYMLALKPAKICVSDIILAVENLKADEGSEKTGAVAKAVTGDLWMAFNAQVMEYLQSVTLEDLVQQQRAQGVTAQVAAPKAAPAARPREPRRSMVPMGVPNSVFALGAMPVMARK